MNKHAPRSPNPIDVHVGTRVRLRRQVMKMSQEKLGDQLGVTFQQVQKYERGANRVGASRLWKMSQVLEVPVGFFYDGLEQVMDDAFPKVDFGAAIPAGENPIADIAGPIWLEIGFGGAEHLLWQAEQNPDVTLLGVEPFLNGVVKAVSGITQNDLKNAKSMAREAR